MTTRASLEITRVLNAKPERVFRAWTTAEELMRWHCPVGYTLSQAVCDARPGGEYAITMVDPDGGEHCVVGTYLDVSPHDYLRMTWEWKTGGDPARGSVLSVNIRPQEDGRTKLTLRHDDLEDEASATAHTEGWNGALDNLTTYLDG